MVKNAHTENRYGMISHPWVDFIAGVAIWISSVITPMLNNNYSNAVGVIYNIIFRQLVMVCYLVK